MNKYKGYITDYLNRDSIDIVDKLANMCDCEISEEVYEECSKKDNLEKIESIVWKLISDKNSRFSKLETYIGLSNGYESTSLKDQYEADLYNNDLLYMIAISIVLGLELPEDSSDIHIYGM